MIFIILLEQLLSNNSSSRLLLIYSNLGEILQINETDIVNKLSSKYNLSIYGKKQVDSQYKISNSFDPLKNYKKASKVILYDIRKI